jgi:hypothetical protein
VTGNLQASILKVSASGVQTLFATFSNVNFAAEGLAIDRAGNVFVVAFDEASRRICVDEVISCAASISVTPA